MQKKLLGYWMLASCLILFACQSKQTSNQNIESTETEVVELPQGFVEFYEQFHEDSLFQINHIAFPLKDEDNTINQEEWRMHHPYNDFGGTYFRDFQVVGNLIIEKMGDKSGLMVVTRRFAKTSDGWNLIYYHVETIENLSPQVEE